MEDFKLVQVVELTTVPSFFDPYPPPRLKMVKIHPRLQRQRWNVVLHAAVPSLLSENTDSMALFKPQSDISIYAEQARILLGFVLL